MSYLQFAKDWEKDQLEVLEIRDADGKKIDLDLLRALDPLKLWPCLGCKSLKHHTSRPSFCPKCTKGINLTLKIFDAMGSVND